MTFVQLWENEKEMALQKYIYDQTGYIIMFCFIFLFSAIFYEINIY
jgi:hypothetical protein